MDLPRVGYPLTKRPTIATTLGLDSGKCRRAHVSMTSLNVGWASNSGALGLGPETKLNPREHCPPMDIRSYSPQASTACSPGHQRSFFGVLFNPSHASRGSQEFREVSEIHRSRSCSRCKYTVGLQHILKITTLDYLAQCLSVGMSYARHLPQIPTSHSPGPRGTERSSFGIGGMSFGSAGACLRSWEGWCGFGNSSVTRVVVELAHRQADNDFLNRSFSGSRSTPCDLSGH